MSDELLTIDQTATLLNVHTRTVSRMIGRDELRAVKVAGRWRIHPKDLNDAAGRDLTTEIASLDSLQLTVKELRGKSVEMDSRIIRLEKTVAAMIAQGAKP